MKKNNTCYIRCLVNALFDPSTQQASVFYRRLSDFMACCCTIVQVTRIIKAKWRIIGPNITGESFSYVFMSHNGGQTLYEVVLDRKNPPGSE